METKETKVTLTKLVADEGMMITNADEGFFVEEVYLARTDSADNYHEVTKEYAEQKEKEAAEKAKAEYTDTEDGPVESDTDQQEVE